MYLLLHKPLQSKSKESLNSQLIWSPWRCVFWTMMKPMRVHALSSMRYDECTSRAKNSGLLFTVERTPSASLESISKRSDGRIGGITSISVLNKYSLVSTPTHNGAQRINEEEVMKRQHLLMQPIDD